MSAASSGRGPASLHPLTQALLRAAEHMPPGPSFWQMTQVVEALAPSDDPEPPARAAAELLHHAQRCSAAPAPLLWLASAAACVAAERAAFPTWRDAGRPRADPMQRMADGEAWHDRCRSADPAGRGAFQA